MVTGASNMLKIVTAIVIGVAALSTGCAEHNGSASKLATRAPSPSPPAYFALTDPATAGLPDESRTEKRWPDVPHVKAMEHRLGTVRRARAFGYLGVERGASSTRAAGALTLFVLDDSDVTITLTGTMAEDLLRPRVVASDFRQEIVNASEPLRNDGREDQHPIARLLGPGGHDWSSRDVTISNIAVALVGDTRLVSRSQSDSKTRRDAHFEMNVTAIEHVIDPTSWQPVEERLDVQLTAAAGAIRSDRLDVARDLVHSSAIDVEKLVGVVGEIGANKVEESRSALLVTLNALEKSLTSNVVYRQNHTSAESITDLCEAFHAEYEPEGRLAGPAVHPWLVPAARTLVLAAADRAEALLTAFARNHSKLTESDYEHHWLAADCWLRATRDRFPSKKHTEILRLFPHLNPDRRFH